MINLLLKTNNLLDFRTLQMQYSDTKSAPKPAFFIPKTAKSDFCGREKRRAESAC